MPRAHRQHYRSGPPFGQASATFSMRADTCEEPPGARSDKRDQEVLQRPGSSGLRDSNAKCCSVGVSLCEQHSLGQPLSQKLLLFVLVAELTLHNGTLHPHPLSAALLSCLSKHSAHESVNMQHPIKGMMHIHIVRVQFAAGGLRQPAHLGQDEACALRLLVLELQLECS